MYILGHTQQIGSDIPFYIYYGCTVYTSITLVDTRKCIVSSPMVLQCQMTSLVWYWMTREGDWTNGFGNRNFMQPMGRLSLHSKCRDFFSFKFWVVVGEDFLSFFPLFPICSLQVPNLFPKGVPNSTSFFGQMFCPKSSPSHLYIGPRGEALHLSIESSIWGSPHSFNFILSTLS
jgi:hypothetical protein